MITFEWVLGIVIVALALAIIAIVLMQSGKDKRLSGSIAGGSETYFGKNKGTSKDVILSRITTVLAILFGIAVVAMYVIVSKS